MDTLRDRVLALADELQRGYSSYADDFSQRAHGQDEGMRYAADRIRALLARIPGGEGQECGACDGTGLRVDEAGEYVCTLCEGTGFYPIGNHPVKAAKNAPGYSPRSSAPQERTGGGLREKVAHELAGDETSWNRANPTIRKRLLESADRILALVRPASGGLTEEKTVVMASIAAQKIEEFFRELGDWKPNGNHELDYCLHGYLEEIIKGNPAALRSSPASGATAGLREAFVAGAKHRAFQCADHVTKPTEDGWSAEAARCFPAEPPEALRLALFRLVHAADAYSADQSTQLDQRSGAVQPITVAEGRELNDALAQARAALEEKP